MSDKVVKPPQTISFKNYFFSALVVGIIIIFIVSKGSQHGLAYTTSLRLATMPSISLIRIERTQN